MRERKKREEEKEKHSFRSARDLSPRASSIPRGRTRLRVSFFRARNFALLCPRVLPHRPPHRAPESSYRAFAISLGRFKAHLSCKMAPPRTRRKKNRAARPRGQRGSALAFYRVRVISGRNESYKFVYRGPGRKRERECPRVVRADDVDEDENVVEAPTTVRLIRPLPTLPPGSSVAVCHPPLLRLRAALKIMAARNRLLIIWIRR